MSTGPMRSSMRSRADPSQRPSAAHSCSDSSEFGPHEAPRSHESSASAASVISGWAPLALAFIISTDSPLSDWIA